MNLRDVVENWTALTEIAEAAGVSVATARRVLEAAGSQPAMTVARLCHGTPDEDSRARNNRSA